MSVVVIIIIVVIIVIVIVIIIIIIIIIIIVIVIIIIVKVTDGRNIRSVTVAVCEIAQDGAVPGVDLTCVPRCQVTLPCQHSDPTQQCLARVEQWSTWRSSAASFSRYHRLKTARSAPGQEAGPATVVMR